MHLLKELTHGDYIFSKNGNYNFGHTALILVNSNDGTNHYFDYGRFEGFKNLGRIRNSISDKKLDLNTRAIIKNGIVLNKFEIFQEVNNNPDTKNLFLNTVEKETIQLLLMLVVVDNIFQIIL